MNNKTAIGYAILALRSTGEVDDDSIQEVIYAMKSAMDEYTESEAEAAYEKF